MMRFPRQRVMPRGGDVTAITVISLDSRRARNYPYQSQAAVKNPILTRKIPTMVKSFTFLTETATDDGNRDHRELMRVVLN